MISGIRLFLFAALLILPGVAFGQGAGETNTASLEQVMQDLAQVRSASAHFVEEKSSQALVEPLQSNGTLRYVAPDHVEKVTNFPEPERLSVTGTQLTIEREGETRNLDLGDYPEIEVFVESIRSTLAGDLGRLEQLYTIGFKGGIGSWTMVLQPIDTSLQQLVTSVRITGGNGALKSIETIGTNGDRSQMTITQTSP